MICHSTPLRRWRLRAIALVLYRELRSSDCWDFETRMEVDAFLKQHGVYLNYTEAELEKDLETLQQLRGQ